jgi:hypothetical protein
MCEHSELSSEEAATEAAALLLADLQQKQHAELIGISKLLTQQVHHTHHTISQAILITGN